MAVVEETQSEIQKVHSWRLKRAIEELGFAPELGEEVAASSVDIHALEALIGAGCDPELAFRILG